MSVLYHLFYFMEHFSSHLKSMSILVHIVLNVGLQYLNVLFFFTLLKKLKLGF